MRSPSIPFPLTLALSLGEREDSLQPLDELGMLGTCETRGCDSLSPGERARVRGNGSSFNLKCETTVGTVKLHESCGGAGGFPS